MRTTKLFSSDQTHCEFDVNIGMRTLSLESEVISNVIDTFRNLVPGVTFKIKELLGTFGKDIGQKSIFDFTDKSKIAREKTKQLDYGIYHKTVITVPEGFKGSFVEYVIVLNKILPHLFSNSNELLGEYNFVLSSFITNKESKTSLKDHTTLYKQAAKIRESVIQEINKFYTTNDKSVVYLGDVIERFSDLDILSTEVRKLEKLHNDQNLDDLKKVVDKSVGLLDIIIKDVQSNDISNVSGAAAKNISEGAYEIAKLVELLSLINFRTTQFLVSVDRLYETISELK